MVRIANDFLSKCIESERCLLCLGWMQPTNLNNIGSQLQLNGQHFCQPEHSFLYTYLCMAAQDGKHPNVDECVSLANKIRVDIDEYYLFNLILWTDIFDGMLRTYAETVRDFSRKRERAERHFQEYRHIVSDGVTSPKRFKHNRKRKKQVTYV